VALIAAASVLLEKVELTIEMRQKINLSLTLAKY
jgi:hypothetical protein